MTSTGRDRLGAVGHRGDRLGTADRVDLVDPGDGRRGEGRGGHPARLAVGRHAEHDLGHAGHPCRHRGHQHRRGVGPSPAGHVAAGAIDGDRSAPHGDAAPLEGVLGPDLGLVELADGLAGRFQRGAQLVGDGVSSASVSSAAEIRSSASTTPSNRSVYSRTARSPRARTSATIACTAATGPSPPGSGRGSPRVRSSPERPRRSSRLSTPPNTTGRGLREPAPVQAAQRVRRTTEPEAALRRAERPLDLVRSWARLSSPAEPASSAVSVMRVTRSSRVVAALDRAAPRFSTAGASHTRCSAVRADSARRASPTPKRRRRPRGGVGKATLGGGSQLVSPYQVAGTW